MDDRIMIHQLALALVSGVGTKTARILIDHLGSVSGVFEEKPQLLARIPGISERVAQNIGDEGIIRRAEQEIRFMEKRKISMRFFQDPDYPYLLRQCQDAPLVIFYQGHLPVRMRHSLSIIGTRNPSQRGIQLCRDWIASLADQFPDLNIISGLAYGIDITAHEACLENKRITLAVLGHGFHTLYPAIHRATADKILERGALISDFFSYNRSEPKNFIRRNRIIAGITEATLVVESAFKGGAMATAEMANSYNREVFAVPGRPLDPKSIGCNYLIRNHQAILANSAADIAFSLGWTPDEDRNKPHTQAHQESLVKLPELQQLILKLLLDEPMSLDQLSLKLARPPARLSGELLNLEFSGWVQAAPGNRYALADTF